MHVLELTAVDRSVTYHRVLYWVRQSNNWPQKAEFYSLSDRLLKTCIYEDFRQLGGRARPTRLVMQDALRSDEESVLEYADMRLRDLPDKMFTKDYLKRAYDSMEKAFHEHGLMFRITGDTIALSPPLIISENEIGEIFDKVRKVIRQVN